MTEPKYAILAVKIANYLQFRFIYELRQQGHVLTGGLIESIESQYKTTANGFVLTFLANDYGGILNTGVDASRIPFGTKTGAKTSKLIQALIGYVEKRMFLRGKAAISVAFAIAKKWKKEGMPTKASYRFSANSRRKFWIDYVAQNSETAIQEYIEEFVQIETYAIIESFFSSADYQRTLTN
jgi:hypothetical protein